jgi:hypothetical protein
MLQDKSSRVRFPMRSFFNWPNSSIRTMTLGSTQPLTEMSTRNLPKGKGRPVRKADNLTAISEPIVYKMWDPRRLTTLLASKACYRESFTFFLFYLLAVRSLINGKGFCSIRCAENRYRFSSQWTSKAKGLAPNHLYWRASMFSVFFICATAAAL